MSNVEKYNAAFIDALGVDSNDLEELEYQKVVEWDSVGHMQLMASLEETFDIELDTDDIIDFSSYTKGKEILQKYEVNLQD